MPDKIFLEKLEVSCVIGAFAWERKVRQKVTIDLEWPAEVRRAARYDNLDHTTDYKGIAKRTVDFTVKSRYRLIETLAEKLVGTLMREFKLPELRIRLSKPGAIRGAKDVGVEITRKAHGTKKAKKKR